MYDIPRNFGIRLRELRLSMGMTQEALAEKLNVTSEYISHLERGTRNISLKKMAGLSKIFGVPLSFFFDDNQTVQDKYLYSKYANDISELLESCSEYDARSLLELLKLTVDRFCRNKR